MKTTLWLLASALGLVCLQASGQEGVQPNAAPVIAKPILFDAPNILIGRVIGPVTAGQIGEGNEVKAFRLQTGSPLTMNDKNDSCGEQTMESLPMLVYHMEKYEGRKVKIKASIKCHMERLGTYAIDKVYFIRQEK